MAITTSELPDTASAVLAFARARRAEADCAGSELLVAACAWADLHPAESIDAAAAFLMPGGSEHEEPVAGSGAPLVAEFCIAEFGAVLGISTVSAKHLIGQALELRHRLPRLWRLVQAGDLPAWRARRIAETTIHAALTREAVAYVEAQLAPFAHRISVSAVDRLVDAAIARFEPARATEAARLAADGRHVTIEDEQVSFAGTMRVVAELDLADALDFNVAVTHGADTLKALGSEESLDARRASAVGEMARTQLSLDLAVAAGSETGARVPSSTSDEAPAARQVVLHVHLTDGDPVAILENGHRLVTLDQVHRWCGQSMTQVAWQPVLDLNEPIVCDGYQPPPRLREQVILRDQTCVFPWCSGPARACDLDHIVPRESGGPTSTANLAALCRRHHRLKTHSAWRYERTGPATYTWTSPHGRTFVRDPRGTEPG
ncbi:HNH endonuclease signature motif containing protein [Nocardioides sp. InS609-2]|uniref:HNH endonuclease signature motif containing protein n=1 Tax=Nocardioides sp. InS609-2 TaxID=2760705 RepID=UPI0020C01F4D|nr:HNH endonuclease signature motif containing protein [Nocardioides sp. InS609-2]